MNNSTFPLFLIPPQILAAIQQQQQLQQLQAQVEETMSHRSELSAEPSNTSRSSQSASTSGGSQSVPLQVGCNFCGIPVGPNGRGLLPCACEAVQYCTDEHKVGF